MTFTRRPEPSQVGPQSEPYTDATSPFYAELRDARRRGSVAVQIALIEALPIIFDAPPGEVRRFAEFLSSLGTQVAALRGACVHSLLLGASGEDNPAAAKAHVGSEIDRLAVSWGVNPRELLDDYRIFLSFFLDIAADSKAIAIACCLPRAFYLMALDAPDPDPAAAAAFARAARAAGPYTLEEFSLYVSGLREGGAGGGEQS